MQGKGSQLRIHVLKDRRVIDHGHDEVRYVGWDYNNVSACRIYKLYDVAVPSRRAGFLPTA